MTRPLIVEAQIWMRVLRFQGESGRLGTAFLVDSGEADQQHLVTADHLTSGERDELVTLTPSAWTPGGSTPRKDLLTRVGALNTEVDIAVFRMNERLAPADLVLPLGTGGMMFSQEILILGYPYNLRLEIGEGRFEIPMAKRGICGAITHNSDRKEMLYLDLIANPGFSGAPVVFRHNESDRLTVAGVVKGTYTQEAVPDEGFTNSVVAGISVATSAGHILDILGLPRG